MKKIKIVLLFCLIIIVSCKDNKSTDCKYSNFELIKDYDELKLNLDIAFDDFGNINKCSKELNKPILTIYGCYNCIGYPKGVWLPLANKEINSMLKEKFLIRYYHIDDSTQLPDSILSENSIKTVGEYFNAKQINKYQINSQPLYTITDWKENDLSKPLGYIPKTEIGKFKKFINEGLITYNTK